MSIMTTMAAKAVVPVEQAVGMVLPHDITEIVKDRFKGRAFRKGHIIRQEDVDHLRRLGKEHIYVLQLGPEEIHENEAALLMAEALAGDGVSYAKEIVEGKVSLTAARDGLLKVNSEGLYRFNLLGEVMCATLQDNTPVKQGEQVAASRLIPLVASRRVVEEAVAIARSGAPIVRVLPVATVRAGLVITGNEVFYGRIKDRFEQVLRDKLAALGSTVAMVRFAPDDLTRAGIAIAGAEAVVYGSPVLPGAMFLVGRIGKAPVLGVPACGMFHRITVLDLVLPRILTGESISREQLARLGHGGLCRNCTTCRYPQCSFGKT